MPLYKARISTSDGPAGDTGSSRISPRPGDVIQNARAELVKVSIRILEDLPPRYNSISGRTYDSTALMNARRWTMPDGTLRASATMAIGTGLLVTIAIALLVRLAAGPGVGSLLAALGLYLAATFGVLRFVAAHHPFQRFGPANSLTTLRLAFVALVCGLILEPARTGIAAAAAVLGVTAALLDGVDGWLARRTRMSSAFGARFDMEVDAALVMALAVLTWRHGKAGPWILFAGLLRYLFVAAGWIWPRMQHPLPPSRRRQTTCVMQIAGLLIALAPITPWPWSAWVATVPLALLSASFLIDIVWLLRPAEARTRSAPASMALLRRGLALAAAVLLLNVSLTFQNVWPTPAVRWTGELSLELAGAVLLLLLMSRRGLRLSFGALRWIAALWVVLVLGHYGEVTAPALYGRDINLYWDVRHVSNVAAMLARAAQPWLVGATALGVAAALWGLYLVLRWALGQLNDAMASVRARRAMGTLAAATFILFVSQRLTTDAHTNSFAKPVTASYAHQAGLAVRALAIDAGLESLPPSPPMHSDLRRLEQQDVLLLFMESYGAISWTRPELSASLTPARRDLDDAIRSTGREVVSAYVESPTFGGVSWLAHISLLSGVEVRDPGTNAVLMTQARDTLVTAFHRGGYRTVAVMPGIWQSWPEGSFYGFDDIYDGVRLGYKGPDFGWWSIPDQFAIARLDEMEVSPRSRAPLFAFFPTISTHTPFAPTPPYQPDWTRVLTPTPFDPEALERVYTQWPDWTNLSPSYATALEYSYTMLAGYLRERPDRDFVMILIGDHQPPAAVSGEGASWDVPVHIIARPGAVLDRMKAHGFRSGLEPLAPRLAGMHAMLPVLLDAFGDTAARTAQLIRTD
jgi:phosphatidylglycerophosphate synthase